MWVNRKEWKALQEQISDLRRMRDEIRRVDRDLRAKIAKANEEQQETR